MTNLAELQAEAGQNLETLGVNQYPGRGLVIGRASTEFLVQVYWVMGRSEPSRNRRLVRDGDIIKTIAHDPSTVVDPSTMIYNAMRRVGDCHIVSNGNQTDTVAAALETDKTLESAGAALWTRSYEDDAPIFTPRITGIINYATLDSRISVIAKGEATDKPDRKIYSTVDALAWPQLGLCVHTYEENGDPPPSFRRAPYSVPVGEDLEETAEMFWNVLDPKNRVALAVKEIDVNNGDVNYKIINKHAK